MSDTSSEHLDLDALSELEEGLTEPPAATTARAHVEVCEDCRARLSKLRTTRALLSALPAEPMPAQVAARLDAALAGAGAPAPTVVPLSGRKRPWQSPAVAGGAAAAAVVLLVAAIVAGTLIHHGNNGNSDRAAAPTNGPAFGGKAVTATKQWATGTNYTPATISALVPRLVTQTPPTSLVPGGGSGGSAARSGAAAQTPSPASSPLTSSVPTYTQQQLRNSAEAVLACGQILAGGVPTTPVAVDFALFEGKPAVIFVLPAVGHPTTKLDVWVVRSTCSSANFDLPLFRVDRP